MTQAKQGKASTQKPKDPHMETYEQDPRRRPRRPDHEGGPYNEPGSCKHRDPAEEGGPFNEPGSDPGPT